jgi:hypothetical protein
VFWPARLEGLERAGYGYTGKGEVCECGTQILWFVTPALKRMALSALKDSRLVPHQSVCARVKKFRVAKRRNVDRARGGPVQTVLFSEKNPAAPASRSGAPQ